MEAHSGEFLFLFGGDDLALVYLGEGLDAENRQHGGDEIAKIHIYM